MVKDNERGSEALSSADLKRQKKPTIDRLNKRLVLHTISLSTSLKAT